MCHRATLGPDVVNRVLDDVQRGRFLVEPAGEDALELSLDIAHVHLDEGARQLLYLPRRRRLAGPQPNDDIVDPDGLPRLQRQVAREPVALVEKAEHRHPLGHGRRAGRHFRDRLRNIDGLRFRLPFRRLLALGNAPAAGCEQRERSNWKSAPHCAPGSSIVPSPEFPSSCGGAEFRPPERLMKEPMRPIMSTEP